MRFFTISAISALAAFVSAYTQPNYSQNPSGNPISLPGLGEQVPVGKPYTITWQSTTPGTVSLVLLRGPSNNVTPIQTIVQNIQNTGKYVWTPPTTLQNDVSHYGLLLVVDATGQYQYSVQFGISNPNGGSSSSSICSSSTGSSSGSSATSVLSSSGTTSSATTVVTPSGSSGLPLLAAELAQSRHRRRLPKLVAHSSPPESARHPVRYQTPRLLLRPTNLLAELIIKWLDLVV